ncbi:MAG: hypothetical protein H7145_13955, partial [Akkermansiaceae bacterium]|nr:hypothetical protein [Armatimonadota bacterium]
RLTADEARRVAPSLLPIIEGLTGSPRRRRAIGEDVVERLYRLWEDLGGQTAPFSGTSMTTLLARTLHCLRPERFPESQEVVSRMLIVMAQGALGEATTD